MGRTHGAFVVIRALATLIAFASGCYLSHERPRDGGPADAGPPDAGPFDAGPDAGRPDAGPRDTSAPPDALRECDASIAPDPGGPELVVDLLFVVDNSISMSEEQRALAAQFPRMVRILATGDVDEDGTPEFQAVDDLHVGVVSTDLGALGARFGGCEVEPAEGDDGILRTAGSRRTPGCARSYPAWLTFSPSGGGSSEELVRDFTCVATIGTQGCGFEQPLEAGLKAVLPSTAGIPFASGGAHGDLENAGFLRDGSILTIVYVTDENDCSVRDLDLFDPESTRYPAEGDREHLRCHLYPEALWPIERYVDNLRALRTDPSSLLVAGIIGVPPDLVREPDRIEWSAILDDPRMQESINPMHPDRLRPACDVKGVGFAVPGRRLVEVAREFGGFGVVQSICDMEFANALGGITSRLGRIIRHRRCRE